LASTSIWYAVAAAPVEPRVRVWAKARAKVRGKVRVRAAAAEP